MGPSDLARAACEGNAKLALTAIKRGAKVNARYKGRPVLLWAIQEGHLNVVKVLVAAGASLKRRDNSGFSALDQAVGEGNIRIVNFLLEAGADVNGQTVNGSPLHTACAHRHSRIAKLLLESGADPSAVGAEGQTPAALTKMGKVTRQDVRLRAMLSRAQQSAFSGRADWAAVSYRASSSARR
jgi:ankyrin repeat protein